MQYVKVAIQTADQGIIYQRDFQVDRIFSALVQRFVGNLTHAGDMAAKSVVVIGNRNSVRINVLDYYKALVVPHYGPFQDVSKAPDVPDYSAIEDSPWISLYCEEPPREQEPMTFFSVYVTVPRRSLWYFSNFRTDDLVEFWSTLRSSLYALHVLERGEPCEGLLYARDDDRADFERDELFLSQKGERIIEVTPSGKLTPTFPVRSLGDFQAQKTQTVEPNAPQPRKEKTGTTSILITRATLARLQEMARSDTFAEQGGVLVGDIYRTIDDQGYIVVVLDFIAAEDKGANEVEFRYTFESWQQQTSILQERFPGKRIVGWYHTHLVKTLHVSPEDPHLAYRTPFFLSPDDLFTHRQFFRDKWYTALVLDTTGNGMFFQWQGDDIVAQPTYYLIEAAGAEE